MTTFTVPVGQVATEEMIDKLVASYENSESLKREIRRALKEWEPSTKGEGELRCGYNSKGEWECHAAIHFTF